MTEKQEAPTLEQLEKVLGDEETESVPETLQSVMEEIGPPAEETGQDQTSTETGEAETGAGAESGEQPPETEAGAGEAEPEAGEAGEEGEGEGESGSDTEESLEPPTDWSVEEQESFRELPEEARRIVLNKTNEARETKAQADEAARKHEALEEVISPRRDAWARNGMDETTAIKQLLALSDYASQSPAEFARMFVQQHSLTPDVLFGEEAGQANGKATAEGSGDDDYTDPEIANLKGHISKLEKQVEDLGGTLQTREQQEQQAHRERINREIEEFSTAKDEKGNLKRPYFEDVKGLMGTLMQTGQASDLQNAYDMACRAHPEVHAKIDAAAKKRSERDQAKERRKKAEAAGKAGASVSGQPGERTPPEPTGDLREDLRREMADRGLV